MLYIILAIILLAAAVTLLRIRIQLEISDKHRLLFVGLGRSGAQFDLKSGQSVFRLLGLRIKEKKKPEKKKDRRKAKAAKPEKKKKRRRERPVADFLKILPATVRALVRYAVSILRSFYIERFEGEVRGGFDQPDLTGTAFGFYQAVLGIAPAAVGRFRFTPYWEGAALGGWARLSVAIPLYHLIGRTIVMFCRLPLRDLIKLAIGKKKGDQDVQ
ncbi:MAG: hypothetical protein JSV52_14650 [Candidatus Zixiibacteriota bacterium]|nr:MAG: hypothetical protein JSV52_14650 [candidate division Zixibacteria bacterium]